MKQTGSDISRTVSERPRLLMGMDLGREKWELAFLGGSQSKPRRIRMSAGDLERLQREVDRARGWARLPADVEVCTCYEAGRDGFWVHRALTALGYTNQVVDSSSIERARRSKEKKTDRIDAGKLVEMLWRHYHQPGERRHWSVVRVPTLEQEDLRQEERDRGWLTEERTRLHNRIRGLLAKHGIVEVRLADLGAQLDALQRGDGGTLPPHTKVSLQRDLAQLDLIECQLRELRTAQQRRLEREAAANPIDRAAQTMMMYRGIGDGAICVAQELAWRDFRNTREVGAAAGLTGCLWSSGKLVREQGLAHTGNPRVRRMMVQLGWCWVRYQPRSALTRWFHERFSRTRAERKKGIIALARKLLIALWKFWTTGEAIEGAVLKTDCA